MKHHLLIILVTALIVGSTVFAIDRVRSRPSDEQQAPSSPVTLDPYRGWQQAEEADVEFKLPPGYTIDAGAGQRFVVKVDSKNPSPIPDMHISTDGEQLNFRRWEGNSWQYWDQVIASIRVKTPMTHKLQINIDK